mgnify:FL=1
MSIPFEETIPTPDKFKGWYAQTTNTVATVNNGVDFEWDNMIINYRDMMSTDGTSSKVTINETGTYYIDCLVNGYGNPLLNHLNRLRGGVTTLLAIGYANNSGHPVYLQAIINGYFELELGDVITIQNSSGGGVQFRGATEGNTWWAGKLVATSNA